MTLRELLGDGPEVEVAALAYDNRAVEPGTLFFCVPGFTRDGHDFAPDAVANIKVKQDGLNNDLHASPEYRAHLITVMCKRAVEAALK